MCVMHWQSAYIFMTRMITRIPALGRPSNTMYQQASKSVLFILPTASSVVQEKLYSWTEV